MTSSITRHIVNGYFQTASPFFTLVPVHAGTKPYTGSLEMPSTSPNCRQ